MAEYRSKYTGAEVDALLDKVNSGEVGGKVTVDSALSTTSENPVQNKVVTVELNKKVNKNDMATINGKSLTEGGNIVIEGGGTSTTPDWNAKEREAGFIQNKIGGDVHLNSLKGVSYITLEDGSRAYRIYGEVYYSKCKDNYSGGYRWYRLSYTERFEYLQDACWGTREWGSENGYQYRFPTAEEINDNYMLEGTIIFYIDPEYMTGYDYIEDIVYWGYNETGVENPIPEWFISNEVARQESVDELREETTALWENLDSGTFPDLTAGDLAGRGESVPAEFGFRASGGKSIKDGRAYIKRIKGNSVVWNQLCKPFANADVKPKIDYTFMDNGGVSVSSWAAYEPFRFNVGLTRNAGHKFLLMAEYTNTSSTKTLTVEVGTQYITRTDEKGTIATIGTIAVKDNTFADYISIHPTSVQDGIVTIQGLRFIDLTQMFQAGNEPSTIEEFQSRVATLGIEDMYAYNEGQVIHCNTESIKSVGDNAWDEQWENGTFNTTTGNKVNHEGVNGQIRCKNPIRVLPNEEYYTNVGMWAIFEDSEHNIVSPPSHTGSTSGNSIYISTGEVFITPSDASYMRFYLLPDYGSTYKHDILISLYHSGWKAQKDDQYQPYWQDTLPLPIIRKYFPDGMKLAGAAHDEIRFNKASGKWEYSKGKIKSVDLGTLGWSYNPTSGQERFFTLGIKDIVAQAQDSKKANLVTSRYITDSFSSLFAHISDKLIAQHSSGQVAVYDSAYTDAASFKAMLQEKQVKLYYESNDWEWVALDAEDQNFRDYYNVADFGTEMSQSQSSVPSAAFSADIIYQFNAVDMIREHEMEINELQSIIATMQAQLASLIQN